MNSLEVHAPLKVNMVGRNVLAAAPSGKARNLLRNGSTQSISYCDWDASMARPELSNGSFHIPYAGDGLRQFFPPSSFSACSAGELGDAADSRPSGP